MRRLTRTQSRKALGKKEKQLAAILNPIRLNLIEIHGGYEFCVLVARTPVRETLVSSLPTIKHAISMQNYLRIIRRCMYRISRK